MAIGKKNGNGIKGDRWKEGREGGQQEALWYQRPRCATEPEYVSFSASRVKQTEQNKTKQHGVQLFGLVSIHSYKHINLHAYSFWFLVFLIPGGILIMYIDLQLGFSHLTMHLGELFSCHSTKVCLLFITAHQSTVWRYQNVCDHSLTDDGHSGGFSLSSCFLSLWLAVVLSHSTTYIRLYSSVLSLLSLYLFCLPWSS